MPVSKFILYFLKAESSQAEALPTSEGFFLVKVAH